MNAKHPYYTEIYQRSFDAIVKNGWLSEILLALITDPLEAEDLAERLERDSLETLWILPTTRGERRYLAPTSLEDFRSLSLDAKTSWHITMAQWVMRFKEANVALQSLIRYDRKLGAWCVCQVAREALRFVPNGELRPLVAIETTEAWTLGKGTIEEAKEAYADIDEYANSYESNYSPQSSFAANAALEAAGSASHTNTPAAEYAAKLATFAAANAAAAIFPFSSPDRSKKRESELDRFREVVANACMTFPM